MAEMQATIAATHAKLGEARREAEKIRGQLTMAEGRAAELKRQIEWLEQGLASGERAGQEDQKPKKRLPASLPRKTEMESKRSAQGNAEDQQTGATGAVVDSAGSRPPRTSRRRNLTPGIPDKHGEGQVAIANTSLSDFCKGDFQSPLVDIDQRDR